MIVKNCVKTIAAATAAGVASYSAPLFASDWEYGIEFYLLAADVSATSQTGEEIGADFKDILDSLEMAVFGSFAAKRDKLTLFANLFYVDTESSERLSVGPVQGKITLGLENLVSTFGAGWQVFEGEKSSLDIVGAARYLSMDARLKLRLADIGKLDEGDSGSNWDGVLGLRGLTDLSDRWYINYYLDLGAGDSDLTWQAVAAINYRLGAVDLTLGYQHLEWKFDEQLLDDLEMSGPALGLKFFF